MDDDDRYEWIEVTTYSDPDPRFLRGRCRHTETEPVHNALTGDLVALLCVTCDTQLPVKGYE